MFLSNYPFQFGWDRPATDFNTSPKIANKSSPDIDLSITTAPADKTAVEEERQLEQFTVDYRRKQSRELLERRKNERRFLQSRSR
jgi:hypothetical protein